MVPMDSKESESGLFLREIPLPDGCDREILYRLPEKMTTDEELIEERWRRWLDSVDL